MTSAPPLADAEWRTALLGIQGDFRPATSLQVAGWAAATVLPIALWLATGVALKTYRQFGWTVTAELQLGKAAIMAVGTWVVLRELRLKYMFGQGTVSAYNTWGLRWSEDLTGIVGVRYMRERSTPTLEISWPDRKRRIVLFPSLRQAVEALVEAARPSTDDVDVKLEDVTGPSWVCPDCHEENLGNFGESWKCLRLPDSEIEPQT